MVPNSDAPVIYLFVFFFGIGFGRQFVVYLLARFSLHSKYSSRFKIVTKFQNWLQGERVAAKAVKLNKYGSPLVTASFLFVGTKSIVNAAAGLSRMRLRYYLPALGVGAIIYATIYTTIGWAAWKAIWTSLH